MESRATRAPAVCAGGIDWPARWRAILEAREATGRGDFLAGGSRWEARAERFARLTRSLDAASDPFVNALREVIRSTDTVLDVGAGAGRYSMPIASSVAAITAVEPSTAMRAELARGAAARGLTNLTVVGSSWETAEVGRHDVAFSANVLYFVPDAVRFIEKLDHHARRACLILHRLDQGGAQVLPLWEEIWGSPRPPEPDALDLFNLLFSIGIRANLRLAPRPAPVRYTTLEGAVSEARQSLDLAPDDPTHDVRIAAFLRGVLIERDGLLVMPPGPQMAIISWESA